MVFQIIFSDNNLHAVFGGITMNERVNSFCNLFYCLEWFSLLFTHKLDTCCQAMCQNVKQSRIQPFAEGEL